MEVTTSFSWANIVFGEAQLNWHGGLGSDYDLRLDRWSLTSSCLGLSEWIPLVFSTFKCQCHISSYFSALWCKLSSTWKDSGPDEANLQTNLRTFTPLEGCATIWMKLSSQEWHSFHDHLTLTLIHSPLWSQLLTWELWKKANNYAAGMFDLFI